jgi:uncharacterized protein YndB with AHSA1/START domain
MVAPCLWRRPTRGLAAASGSASAGLTESEHESSDEYLEVVKPERLSMSWRWTGGAEDPGESLVEIRLRVVAEGTELTLTHSRLRDEESRPSHEEGWTGALDKLERHFLIVERNSP